MGLLDLVSGTYRGIGNKLFGRATPKTFTQEIFSFKGIMLAAILGGTAIVIIKSIR